MADGEPRPPAHEGGLARWVTTAWCLLAGALLAVTPLAHRAWSDAFFERWPSVQDLLWTDAARWGIAGFGLALLAAGAWDVSRFVVEELG